MTMICYCRSSPKASLADDFAWSMARFRERTGRTAQVARIHADDSVPMSIPNRVSRDLSGGSTGTWCLTDGDDEP